MHIVSCLDPCEGDLTWGGYKKHCNASMSGFIRKMVNGHLLIIMCAAGHVSRLYVYDVIKKNF